MSPRSRIPALSIKQPWAWAIVSGYKTVENRSWVTSYRGELLIHASRRLDHTGFVILENDRLVAPRLPEEFTIGAIVGQVTLVDIVSNARSRFAIPGRNHFVLRDPRAFDNPIPLRGQLGVWWPDLPRRI